MLWPLLHWTTYEEGALPLGASHMRARVQSVTPVTRRFFGADWASAGFALPRETTPNRIMPIAFNASFPIVTCGLLSNYDLSDRRQASSRPRAKSPGDRETGGRRGLRLPWA